MLGDFSTEARGKADQVLAVLGEEFFVYPGFVVEALGEGGADEFDQVLVAVFILGQEHEVELVFIQPSVLLGAVAGRDIDLAAKYRLDSGGFGFTVEYEVAVHYTVVGDGYGRLLIFFSRLDEVFYPACAVKKAELSMRVKVNKSWRAHLVPKSTSCMAGWLYCSTACLV